MAKAAEQLPRCTGWAHLSFWFGPSPSLLRPHRFLRMSQNWPDLWSWAFSVKPEAKDWFSFQLTALCPQESLLLRWPTKLAYGAGLYMSPQPYFLTFRDMSLSGNWPTAWLYFSWRSEATVMSSLTFGSGWENRVKMWLFQCEDFHSVCRRCLQGPWRFSLSLQKPETSWDRIIDRGITIIITSVLELLVIIWLSWQLCDVGWIS